MAECPTCGVTSADEHVMADHMASHDPTPSPPAEQTDPQAEPAVPEEVADPTPPMWHPAQELE